MPICKRNEVYLDTLLQVNTIDSPVATPNNAKIMSVISDLEEYVIVLQFHFLVFNSTVKNTF